MKLTHADLLNLQIAVQLRAESCEENDELADARRWRKLQGKLEAQLRVQAGAAQHPDSPATFTLLSSDEAATCADTLINESSPYSLEPLPDDEWRLTAKPAMVGALELRLGRELQ